MPDGAYIELLSFTHPESHYPPSSPSHEERRRQPWANKDYGWVAYAFLGAPSSLSAPPNPLPPLSTVVNGRLRDMGSSTRYELEVSGGRRRTSDGFELKWEITQPARWSEKVGGTRLPFFCGDLTPREMRVRDAQIAIHISSITDAVTCRATGTDAAEVKHRTSKWCAGHCAYPRAGPTQRIPRSC